jgi:hypothetical protein
LASGDHRWFAVACSTASSNTRSEATIGDAEPDRATSSKSGSLAGKAGDGCRHRCIAAEVTRGAARHKRERARLGDFDARHDCRYRLHHALEGTGIARWIVLLDAYERAARLRIATTLTDGNAIGCGRK